MMTSNILLIVGVFAIILVTVLVLLVVNRTERLHELQASLRRMTKSFNDLDEQAKLIVRTDLELNKTQEELDKRLNGLDALQKTSRLISTTLDENEIFKRLDQSLIVDLGFEKNLICIYDKNQALQGRLNVGFSPEDVQFVVASLEKEKALSRPSKKATRSPPPPLPPAGSLSANRPRIHHPDIRCAAFCPDPILTQDNISGILFVGEPFQHLRDHRRRRGARFGPRQPDRPGAGERASL